MSDEKKREVLELGTNIAVWWDMDGDWVEFVRPSQNEGDVRVETDTDRVYIPVEKLVEALAHIGVELPAKSMTAREHLDAAWEAAHVPPDGRIPAGAPYIACVNGDMTTAYAGPGFRRGITSEMGGFSARLLDLPAPVWAEDKHIMATLPNGNTAMLQRIDTGWLSFDGETYTADQLRDVKRVNVEGDEDE